ncbi:hypothetical protein FB565_003198 [Actinoplanes lutulentus]|uniref:Uncharacterized protein DUF1203 n=1 Tax=Actinoplanes lutulentus TaxID=1287878 RepID=A0A327Z5L9_9ACTN|nr:DUF1203 domain-containing protein [Actinoplanes lutulentus]MBB2943485.1 hypothetical protein [Actinoplanes lutulentus]RAK25996.1 uncharacterized protein DUF1203 [Actinoplanes lutulentus]
MTTFQIHALPQQSLDGTRRSGLDVSGTKVEHLVATGGESLRCCLRDATAGEEIMLFGYEPPLPAGPYREIGAVFAHASACAGPAAESDYPAGWHGRPQVLRAYDKYGRIHPATRLHDGSDPEAAISAVLDDPEVVLVHSRNVAYGCFMFSATRAGARP